VCTLTQRLLLTDGAFHIDNSNAPGLLRCTAELGEDLYGTASCSNVANYSLQYEIPTGDGYGIRFYVCSRHYAWYFNKRHLKCIPHHEVFKLVFPGDEDPDRV
jgi:hypothetical protein